MTLPARERAAVGLRVPSAPTALAGSPPTCLVAGDESFDEDAERLLLVCVEPFGRLEAAGEHRRGRPAPLAEDELVSADRQCDGQAPQSCHRGLGHPRLVAAQLGHVDARALGQLDLGEVGRLTGRAQVLGELHGRDRSHDGVDGCESEMLKLGRTL